MSHCTFCVTDGGEEGCKKVNDPKAIRFICQQFKIDFEKTFGQENIKLDPLNRFPLILSLCTKCHKQFEEIRRIQFLLEEMKDQLDKVLSEVRNSVISSPLQIKVKVNVARLDGGTVGEDFLDNIVSKNCRMLRTEIRRISSIEKSESKDYEAEKIPKIVRTMGNYYSVPPVPVPPVAVPLISAAEKPQEIGRKVDGMETDNRVEVEGVQIKTEETQMYENEDVEEFQTTNVMPTAPISRFRPIASINSDNIILIITDFRCPPQGELQHPQNLYESSTSQPQNPYPENLNVPSTSQTEPQNPYPENINVPSTSHSEPENPYPENLNVPSTSETEPQNPCPEKPSSKKSDQELYISGYKCELCNMKKPAIRGINMFRRHIQQAHKSAKLVYPCRQRNCNKKFPVQILMERHKLFHEQEMTKKYGCEECDKRFLSSKDFDKHLKWHEKQFNLDLFRHQDFLMCRFCKKKSNFFVNIRNHELEKHQDQLVHSCVSCDQKYSSASILESHVKVHSSEGPYQCSICETTCENGTELDGHLIKTHIPRPKRQPMPCNLTGSSCNVCGKFYNTRAEMKKHWSKVHGPPVKYECEICPDKKFITYNTFLKHALRHENTGNFKEQLTCPQCPKQFVTNFVFQRHIKYHSLDATKPLACEVCDHRFHANDLIGLENHKESAHENKRKRVKCTAVSCDKSFGCFTQLRRHEYIHHPELFIYNCKLCDKVYAVEAFLETHLKTHWTTDTSSDKAVTDTGTVVPFFGCSVCPSKFSSANDLADHLPKHTAEPKHFCTKCPKKCFTSEDLIIHMAVKHGAKKRFKCKVCAKEYNDKCRFNEHKLSHEDPETLPKKPPKICGLCGLQFSSATLLRNHRKSKHKPKLPKVKRICDICGKSVTGFTAHMRTHTGDKRHKCYFCNKGFVQTFSLTCHLLTHTGERPFICHICHKDFPQMHCLKTHIKNVHVKNGTFYPKPPEIELMNNDDVEAEVGSSGAGLLSLNKVHSESLDFDALLD